MKQVPPSNPLKRLWFSFSALGNTQRKVLLAGLIAFFTLALATVLVLAYSIYEPQILAYLATATPTMTPSPTPRCVQPTLQLGADSYPLKVISLPGNGSLPNPEGNPGTTWWVSGTFSPFVFFLNPRVGSTDLRSTLHPGDPVVVQWADCGREEYVLTDVQEGLPNEQALLAQDTPGIAVIVPETSNNKGYVLHGQRSELINPLTPEPTEVGFIPVDLTFGETVVSADQTELTTSVTLTNRGSQAIHLTTDDFSLTAEGASPLQPLSIEPALPQDLQPGASLSLTLVFPNPGGHTAVLRVLDITLDLYY